MATRKRGGCSNVVLLLLLGLAVLTRVWARDASHKPGRPHTPPPTAATPGPAAPTTPQEEPDSDEPAPTTDDPAAAPHDEPDAVALDPRSAWSSPTACEAALRARPQGTRRHAPGVATWNLAWFPDGSANGPSPTRGHDIEWLACSIAWLDVQVLAVQEVVQHARGRAALLDLRSALDARTHGKWQAELDECPDDGRQHVGFLYDAAHVTLGAVHMLGELNPGRNACDRRLRPGLSVRFDWYGGPSLDMLTLHLDSGQTPRDYGNRQTSLERLRGAAAELQRRDQRGVLVLGDFNTMGCERCEPKVTAEQEQAAMAALEQQATPALSQLPLDRACTEYYRGKGSVLDHVLWMPPPARVNEPLRARASVQGLCAELACGHVTHAHHPAALDHLSDHCPVLVDWPQLQPHGAPTARGKLRP